MLKMFEIRLLNSQQRKSVKPTKKKKRSGRKKIHHITFLEHTVRRVHEIPTSMPSVEGFALKKQNKNKKRLRVRIIAVTGAAI